MKKQAKLATFARHFFNNFQYPWAPFPFAFWEKKETSWPRMENGTRNANIPLPQTWIAIDFRRLLMKAKEKGLWKWLLRSTLFSLRSGAQWRSRNEGRNVIEGNDKFFIRQFATRICLLPPSSSFIFPFDFVYDATWVGEGFSLSVKRTSPWKVHERFFTQKSLNNSKWSRAELSVSGNEGRTLSCFDKSMS